MYIGVERPQNTPLRFTDPFKTQAMLIIMYLCVLAAKYFSHVIFRFLSSSYSSVTDLELCGKYCFFIPNVSKVAKTKIGDW